MPSVQLQGQGVRPVPGWAQRGHSCPAAAAGTSPGAREGAGTAMHCQHDSAPPQASRLRSPPSFFPSVASNGPGHQFPGREQKVPGPTLRGLSEAAPCGSEAPGVSSRMGRSQRPSGTHFPRKEFQGSRLAAFPTHTHFQGSPTGLWGQGSGQEGNLGS